MNGCADSTHTKSDDVVSFLPNAPGTYTYVCKSPSTNYFSTGYKVHSYYNLGSAGQLCKDKMVRK